MTSQLYQERLMDHFRHPRNKGALEHPDFASGEYNPSCGDSVSLTGFLKDGKLCDLRFDGVGCVISQAAASLLTQACIGKSCVEIKALDASFVLDLVAIPLGPTRLKCALLSLQALQRGILHINKSACKG